MFLSSKLDAYLSKPIRLLFTTYLGLTLGMGACFFYWSWRSTQQRVADTLLYQGQVMYQSTEGTFQSFESLLIILGQRLVEQGAVQDPELGRVLIDQTKQLHQGMAGFGLARS
ncbi:MAG: hypothetical protein ACO3EZ_14595, partial [Prochlorotrichaceae cyanobacterium]